MISHGTDTEPVDVLVVEDDGPTRAVITEILEYAGYAVCGAPDGAAALALAERLHPRVVLLDLCMPVMDGWQFVAHYRNAVDRPAPIVLLSAHPNLPAATEELGAYGFLCKPFDLDYFRDVVVRAIMSGERARSSVDAHMEPRRNGPIGPALVRRFIASPVARRVRFL